jgi:hypothetical protein
MGEAMSNELSKQEAIDTLAKLYTAHDAACSACEWIVARYFTKSLRTRVAALWRELAASFLCVEDVMVDAGAARRSPAVILSVSMKHLPRKLLSRPTLADHAAQGAPLEAARVAFLKSQVRLSAAMPMRHRSLAALARIERCVDRLKSALDETVCAEHPDHPAAPRCYYGTDQ